jgi:hypothetical protein
MVRYHFLPTYETCKVLFGRTFAFVSLEGVPTELLTRSTERSTRDELEANPWLGRYQFDSFIPRHTGDEPHPQTPHSTRIFLAGGDQEGVCLGCYLFERKVANAHSTPVILPSDENDDDLHADGDFLAVFPTPERRIAAIDSFEAMYCQICEDAYHDTRIWHEAGIQFDAHNATVQSPVIVPFNAGRYAEFTYFDAVRDEAYLGFWSWTLPPESQSELRPFRLPSFEDALDALEAVAVYQDNRQIRQLGHQVLQRLGPLLTKAYWEIQTTDDLETLIIETEWVGAEQFVARFLLDMWQPLDGPGFADELMRVAAVAAKGLPALSSARDRAARAILQIGKYVDPSTRPIFRRIAKAVCIEHRIIAAKQIVDMMLDAATEPSLLSADFSQLTVSAPTEAVLPSHYTQRRAPIKPLIARRDLDIDNRSLAMAANFGTHASFVARPTDSRKPAYTAAVYHLKDAVYDLSLWEESDRVAQTEYMPDPSPMKEVEHLSVRFSTKEITVKTGITYVLPSEPPARRESIVRVLGLREVVGVTRIAVYAFTSPSERNSDVSPSKLELVIVPPTETDNLDGLLRHQTKQAVLALSVLDGQRRLGAYKPPTDDQQRALLKAVFGPQTWLSDGLQRAILELGLGYRPPGQVQGPDTANSFQKRIDDGIAATLQGPPAGSG